LSFKIIYLGRVAFHPSAVIYELLGDIVIGQTLLLLNEIHVTRTALEKKIICSHLQIDACRDSK
jgi:hypothetical protein